MKLDRRAIMADYGAGHVYKRGKIYWIQFYAHGKRHRESSNSELKRDARNLLNKRLVEFGGRPVNVEAPTFERGEAVIRQDYRDNNKGTPEKRLKRLRPFFRGTDLSTVTSARLQVYRDQRHRDGVKGTTINRELACLRRMMNLMRKQGANLTVPYFPMANESNVRTGFVTETELQALLPHLPPRVRPVVEFGYVTGWRKGEIVGLDWSNVTERCVRLEPGTTKNDDGREFPLIPRLKAVIEGQRARMGDRLGGPLFFYYTGTRAGRPIKSFRRSWDKATAAAKLDGLLFHDLRRSAVRNLVLSGIDKHTAMRLTGHRTDSVFDRYDIIDSARLHEQASKLEAFYGKQESKVRAIK